MRTSKINEFLSKIKKKDIFKAMTELDKIVIPNNRKSVAYDLINLDTKKLYPPSFLIEKAYEISTGDNLPEGFFSNIGKNSPHFIFLEGLDFEIRPKNFRYYLKKVSDQDVKRTTVVNKDSLYLFFKVSLKKRDDEATIKLNYLKDNSTYTDVKIILKQDPRIFIEKSLLEVNDILLFSAKDKNHFDLAIIKQNDIRYQGLNSSLKRNYLLTDELPDIDMIPGTKTNFIMNEPLNQILYGPPGTGKTYSTITKALNIIGLLEEKETYTKEEYAEAQELFQNELGKRIEFVTMHQSFSYEDFVQGLKPLKPKEGEGITFDYKNGVFKEICKRTDLLRKEFKSGSDQDRLDFEVVYNYSFKSLFEDNEPIVIKRGKTQMVIHEFSDKTLWFETSNGTTHPRYTLAKKTLKKIYDSRINNIIKSGNKGYFDAALDFLLENEKKIKDNKQQYNPEQNINHVIILDEINRANISRVFGELIALIEKDKRDGKLTATLPSGEPFTVPSNLYIIGTMNTADKSIALVDIALRRRFEFTALYPNTDILSKVLKENEFTEDEIKERVNLLRSLNRIIRSKKSVDFEIGHSYFMESDSLINILNKQVLPLLNEYFMYDLRKVKEIIEKKQKDKEGKSIPKPGIVFNKEIWKDRGLLEVQSIKPLTDESEQVEAEVISDES